MDTATSGTIAICLRLETATNGTIAFCQSLGTATNGTIAVCQSLPHVETQKTMQWQSLQQYQLQSRWLLAYRQSSADKWQDGIIIVDLVIMAIGKMALLLLLSNFTLVTNITNTDVSFNKNINKRCTKN